MPERVDSRTIKEREREREIRYREKCKEVISFDDPRINNAY